MIDATLRKFERNQPFTDKDAWLLFKIAAIGEACGWSLLITGILFKRYVTPANNVPVLIAGQIHGTIFLAYIVAVVVLYSSLRWSRKRAIIAGLASVPPYGSLIFEQWAAYKRRSEALKTYRELTVHAIIIRSNKLLVIQPKDSGFWHTPGGMVRAGETAEQALKRVVAEQTGISPSVGRLAYIRQYRYKSTERLEMYFHITNSADYEEQALIRLIKKSAAVDEIGYIIPKGNQALRPAFLQTEPIISAAKNENGQVISIQP